MKSVEWGAHIAQREDFDTGRWGFESQLCPLQAVLLGKSGIPQGMGKESWVVLKMFSRIIQVVQEPILGYALTQ